MQYDSSTYTDLTDEKLIRLVQSGDEEAFAQLAARYSSRIWQLVVWNSRQVRDAEEIFQDIWVAVWETSVVSERSQFRCMASEDSLYYLQKVLHPAHACEG